VAALAYPNGRPRHKSGSRRRNDIVATELLVATDDVVARQSDPCETPGILLLKRSSVQDVGIRPLEQPGGRTRSGLSSVWAKCRLVVPMLNIDLWHHFIRSFSASIIRSDGNELARVWSSHKGRTRWYLCDSELNYHKWQEQKVELARTCAVVKTPKNSYP
jgi:hypothetical protein